MAVAWLGFFFYSKLFFYLGIELTVKGNQFKVSDHSNGLLCCVWMGGEIVVS